MKFILLPIGVLSVIALTACGGGGSSSSSTPNSSANVVPTATATPTVVAKGVQTQSFQPLVDGAQWNYLCASGVQSTTTTTIMPQMVNGVQLFFFTSTNANQRGGNLANAASTVLGNDSSGNLTFYGYYPLAATPGATPGPFQAAASPIVIEPANPSAGQVYTIPEYTSANSSPQGNAVTSFAGSGPVVAGSTTYPVAFKFSTTYTKYPKNSSTYWDVRGLGTVRYDYTDSGSSDSCSLSGTNVINGG